MSPAVSQQGRRQSRVWDESPPLTCTRGSSVAGQGAGRGRREPPILEKPSPLNIRSERWRCVFGSRVVGCVTVRYLRCDRRLRRSGVMWHCTDVTPGDEVGTAVRREDLSSGECANATAAIQALPASPVVTTTPSTALSSASTDLKRLEDEILERSLKTVQAALHWEDIEEGQGEPPAEWVEELGLQGAMKRLRVARAALKNAKEAPVGLGMARTTAVGILKVRSSLKAGTPTLNINLVSFQAPPTLDVIDVESE